jgi:dihydroorotase-like cyclic amidohydrolase
VAFYLAQRSDLAQLFADLEGNADLLGREPRLGPVAAPARGLVLAERLLADWQAERSRHQREIGAELSALGQRIEQGQGELAEARREAEELRARLLDSEEERELIQLQLQQVQEELVRTFEELSQARERGEAAGQRLARLEQECRTLFLHCHLSEGIDRSQIATILQVVRESLQI